MSTINRRQLLGAGAGAALAGLLAARDPSSTSASGVSTGATTTVPAPPSTAPADAVDDLRRRLQGNVLTPLDASYPGSALAANTRYASTRPAVIAQCRDETDVVTCIHWTTENGVAPVVRGGGHSYAGLSTTTGLMIDISALDLVTVDPATGVAQVAGAALNGDVLDKTIHTPFLLPGGTCLGVGTGGLVLGGGIGYNTHWAGLTCDHLTSTRVVLASGEVVDADATTHRDLFWACRGGMGGNFGINTAFTFQLVEAPQTVTYFRYDFRGADDAGAMLSAIHRVVQTAPAGLNASSAAQASPVGSGGPREAIDAFTRGQYVGPSDELRDLLAPVLAAATPTKSAFQEMPFWDVQQQIWASANPPPHSFGDWSRYAREPLPDDAVAEVMDLLAACPVRTASASGSVWFLGWVGGEVVDRFARTDTAYVHRGLPMLLRPTPVWAATDPSAVGDDLLAWTEDVIGVIAPLTPDESYQNFPNRLLPNPLQQYFAENLEPLIDVKTAYDPGNLFQSEQSIPTR
jgi:FAD/FMN-containing dehydrogenase